MLVLAIISTVILAVFILLFFGAMVEDGDAIIYLIIQSLLAFVIVTIWVLYAK